MKKNYIKEFLKDNGLEEGERFILNNLGECEYWIENNELFYSNELNSKIYSIFLYQLLIGNFNITSTPFKPKDGKEYFFIGALGAILSSSFSYTRGADLLKYQQGNCFKTFEQAKINKPIIMEKFNDILKELEDK